MKWALASLAVCTAGVSLAASAAGGDGPSQISLSLQGRYAGEGAEIAAYDRKSERLFITDAARNRVDIVSIADPAHPALVRSISVEPGSPNSVAVSKGVVAVAVEAPTKTDPGVVRFYDADGDTLHPGVTVGALPDMLLFTENHRYLLVANEGEPSGYGPGHVDPEGSVSVIDLRRGVRRLTQDDVETAGFGGVAIPAGVRIFGPGATPAQDLEPESITVDGRSRTAWVTLQEANAIAELDIDDARFRAVRPLGSKNHNAAGNALDPSDRDGAGNAGRIAIVNRPVLGMYMPDAIGAFSYKGDTYLATANEGDARDWPGFAEEARVSDLDLDNTAFPDEAALKNDDDKAFGRLTVTRTLGNADGDGDYEELYALGGRSFSIWSERGRLVFDSGDAFEQITAAQLPALFNSESGAAFDSRSDNKGPEPEGLALGEVRDRTYAFVGFERIGGVIVYDVSKPRAPRFVQYVNPEPTVDRAPEGLFFIGRDDSPTKRPLLVVTNEVSGTTAVYQIDGGDRGGDEDDDDDD
jgi:hypothetical protein